MAGSAALSLERDSPVLLLPMPTVRRFRVCVSERDARFSCLSFLSRGNTTFARVLPHSIFPCIIRTRTRQCPRRVAKRLSYVVGDVPGKWTANKKFDKEEGEKDKKKLNGLPGGHGARRSAPS